jgi:hypothetical protein
MNKRLNFNFVFKLKDDATTRPRTGGHSTSSLTKSKGQQLPSSAGCSSCHNHNKSGATRSTKTKEVKFKTAKQLKDEEDQRTLIKFKINCIFII